MRQQERLRARARPASRGSNMPLAPALSSSSSGLACGRVLEIETPTEQEGGARKAVWHLEDKRRSSYQGGVTTAMRAFARQRMWERACAIFVKMQAQGEKLDVISLSLSLLKVATHSEI